MTVRPALRMHVFLATISALLFTFLLIAVDRAPHVVLFFDQSVAHFLSPFQTFPLVSFFLGVTELGSALGIAFVSGVLLYCIRKQRHNIHEFLWLLSLTVLSVDGVKLFVERARPESLIWLPPLTSYSFPSGHTAGVVALYGFIALLLYRQAKTPRTRVVGILFCVLVIFLVSLSRLILNVHFASDVLGGMALATFWLLVVRTIGARK